MSAGHTESSKTCWQVWCMRDSDAALLSPVIGSFVVNFHFNRNMLFQELDFKKIKFKKCFAFSLPDALRHTRHCADISTLNCRKGRIIFMLQK